MAMIKLLLEFGCIVPCLILVFWGGAVIEPPQPHQGVQEATPLEAGHKTGQLHLLGTNTFEFLTPIAHPIEDDAMGVEAVIFLVSSHCGYGMSVCCVFGVVVSS